jgi:hypothetical protein
MKINILLGVVLLSFTLIAYSNFSENSLMRIGGTELNGNGCVCHNLYADPNVVVWVDGPETLRVGQTGRYKMFLTGGPAEAGGYNVAGRFGVMEIVDTISVWDNRAPNELTQSFPLVFPTPQDTIFWPFEYTASGLSNVDTIYSVGLSIVYDSIPDFHDVWAFGPKFPLTITDIPIPVELSSFDVEQRGNAALIKWTTATELNNKGFEIQKNNSDKWVTIGFVEGKGTTTERATYTFTDRNPGNGITDYRLKQIDFNGKFQYSKVVELNVENIPLNFELRQNYPNPFNPITTIQYQLPVDYKVTLKVYDILGNEVETLANEFQQAGYREEQFDASELSSGIYIYSLNAGNYVSTKKMIYLK